MRKFSGRVFCLGNIIYNISTMVNRFPQIGETVYSERRYINNSGGKGLNQAITSSQYGAETYLIGTLGNDGFALNMENDLKASGVQFDYIQYVKGESGLSLLTIRKDGKNKIVCSPNVNKYTESIEIDKIKFTKGDILISTMEFSYEFLNKLFQKAKKSGAFIMVDPSSPKPLNINDELYKTIDLLKPNEVEIELIIGNKIDNYEKALNKLKAAGITIPLISLGEKGVIYLNEANECVHLSSLKVDAIDTTGAGDIFVGSLAAMLASNQYTVDEALANAIKISGLSVTKQGALPSIPTNEMLKEYGIEI